ncbi:MAG: LysR family transcriptional regulator [Bryobacteraceae bacterium]
MEFRQLEIFRVLADELNFTRTAERVHCVQSNVTVQIRALETELGVALFERLGKQVRLTEHGRRLVQYAERVLGLLEEAKVAVSVGEEPRGLLRIGVPESVLTYRLPLVLQALRERYPAIELNFSAESCAKLWNLLVRGGVDLVLTISDFPHQARLHVETLCKEPMVLLAHPGNPLSTRDDVALRDLQTETMLLTEEDCSYRNKLEQLLARGGVQPAATLTFTSVEAIKQCAALGIGIAYLPRITAEAELASGRLAALRWTGPRLEMHTLAAWHKDKWQSPAMIAFLKLLDERFPREAVSR